MVDSHEGAWTLVAPRLGTAILAAGTNQVANTTCTANTIVILSRQTAGGTLGAGGLTYAVTAGTGFVISSVGLTGLVVATDTSTVAWKLEEVPN